MPEEERFGNSEDRIRLRKYEHALVISGVGVIAFGVWSLIKAVAFFVVSPLSQLSGIYGKEQMAQFQAEGVSELGADIVMMVFVLIVLVVDLLLRYYIGRSAITDGRRLRRKRGVYIILAALVAIGLLSGIVSRIAMTAAGTAQESGVLDTITVSGVVDLTSFLALAEMTYAAVMVRRLRKKPGQEQLQDTMETERG